MRFIGIRHRVKKTAKGEARPTQVAIIDENGDMTRHELETILDEKDFVLGLWPSKWRKVEPACAGRPDEDMSKFFVHQIKWKKVKEDEEWETVPESQRRINRKKERVRAAQVPEEYDGLRPGDSVAMLMGGSGGMFAGALSKRGQVIGAKVVHAPTYVLMPLRDDDRDKDKDPEILAQLVRDEPNLFYEIIEGDRNVIEMAARHRSRMDAMTERRACAQRLRQRCMDALFLSEDDNLDDIEDFEDYYQRFKKTDVILTAVEAEEGKRDAELAKAIKKVDVYTDVFSQITGCGPAIAGAIIAAVVDMTRFDNDAKFKKFAGVHVLADGSFPRRRRGEKCGWGDGIRQAFYQLTDQFIRQKDKTEWGRALLAHKANFREKHPVPLVSVRVLSEFFRRIERFFLRLDVTIDPAEYTLNTADGLYHYFDAGAAEVEERFGEEEYGAELKAFEKEFEAFGKKIEPACAGRPDGSGRKFEGRAVKQERVTLYSPGHIHNMARWRTATRVAEWIYREWTKQAMTKKKAAAMAAAE